MKFIITLFLFMFSFNLQAAQIEILDSKTYQKILDSLGVSNKDISLYEEMFKASNDENWKKFDTLTHKVENKILMGHLLARKYLSNQYKSNKTELEQWIEKYKDHIEYSKICKFLGKNPSFFARQAANIINSKQKTEFKKALKNGKTKQARIIWDNPKFKKSIPKEEYYELGASLAFAYFLDNMDGLALQYASKIADNSNDITAHWIAGLSSYRQKKFQTSAKYFDKLSKFSSGDEWVIAGGGYWAYLSYKKLGNQEKAIQALKRATTFGRTFYGVLAAKKLGLNNQYAWQSTSYINDYNSNEYINQLLQSPVISRALVLLKIGQKDLAIKELQRNLSKMTESQKESVMYIANQYKIYHLAILIANQIKDNQNNYYYDDISYPAPKIKPKGGWDVDKALIFALTRQESGFYSQAVSPSGARGLMQLMPNTAFHITKDISYRNRNKDELFKEDLNLDLGQKYVAYLLNKPYIQGNLFFMMAAYNAGPTKFLRWQKNMNYQDNPLLFIETLPARETRLYIKRVMTNYWIYSARLGQDNQSLDSLLKAKWPFAN